MINWKRNLVIIWFSQFLSMSGFSFSVPFAPFFMQSLGVTDSNQLKLWVSLFSAATPLTLAFFSPLWGALADRYGRKLMLLRANFAGALVIGCMGLAPNVQMLIFLRAMQGMFTGTMTASQTLVSVYTPKERTGFALGILTAAVFSGTMIGAFLGGFFAELFGYRIPFFISGLMLLIGGLLVYFGVEEHFIPASERVDAAIPRKKIPLIDQFGPAGLILGLIVAISFIRQFDQPFIPLVVQQMQGSFKGAAFKTGILSAAAGIAGFISAIVIGKLADKYSPPRIAKYSAVLASVTMIVQGFTDSFTVLLISRFAMTFFAGGLEPVFQIWLAKTTPQNQRGFIFGWAGTARSAGWFIAPLIGGYITTLFTIHAIFHAGALFYLLIIVLIAQVVKRITVISGMKSAAKI